MDKTAVLFSYYDFKQAKLFIIDELLYDKSKMTTQSLALDIRKKEALYKFTQEKVLRRADTNNPIVVRDLSVTHALPFGIVKKDSLEAMVNNVRLWFGNNRVVIHPRCKYLIETMKSAIWNETRTDLDHSETLGHYDLFAALMYLLRSIDTKTNPIPYDSNFTFETFDPYPEQNRAKHEEHSTSNTFKQILDERMKD